MGICFDDGASDITDEIVLTDGTCVEQVESRGRICTTTRDLQPGDVAMIGAPLTKLVFPSMWDERCSYCMILLSKLQRCTSCQAVFYCSRACQKADWANHGKECSHLNSLKNAYPSTALCDILLCARIARIRNVPLSRTPTKATPGLQDDAEVSKSVQKESERQQQQWILGEKVTAELGADTTRSVPSSAHVPRKADFDALVFVPGPDDATHLLASQAARLCNAPLEVLRNILNRFSCNNFAIVDELFNPIAAGVYPHGAMLNHSCAPNCVLTYHKGFQLIRVIEPVLAGDELTHSYVDICQPKEERQDYLQNAYNFRCNCKKCEGEDVNLTMSPRGTALENAKVQKFVRNGELDMAIKEAKELVEPDHMDLQELHASAMNDALEAGKLAEAIPYCQWLMKQYQAKYPEIHPLVGLHAYTLGDLKRLKGDRSCIEDYRLAKKILSVTHGGEMVRNVDVIMNNL
eukprot:GEMP01018085.1.p1 GENE.GEMP01018085.1~~GEMP01018085.1.p1  ORF type:complete len:489 (+),score=95.54 GEMP01018085.1:81-1469(+)